MNKNEGATAAAKSRKRNMYSHVATMGMLGALLVIVQVALSFLPNIELVSLLIIVYALVIGKAVFAPIAVFILTEGLIYGFGLWWLNYIYIWPLLALLALLLRKERSRVFWAVISGGFGLFFGALCALPYLFIGGLSTAIAYWIGGIPFDILHGVGNAAVAFFLFTPSIKAFEWLMNSSHLVKTKE